MIPSRARGPAVHALLASLLAGGLTYVVLALVSRTVDSHQFDQFSVFWSIALIIGFGLFLPVEQEAARLGRGTTDRRDAMAAMMVTASVIAGISSVVLLLALPALVAGLDLTLGLGICCVLVVVASAVQFAARGALLSASRFRAFSNTLILDTVLRVAALGAVAVLVLTAGLSEPGTWYAFALIGAIVAAHVWAVPWRSWSGTAPVRRAFVGAALLLIGVNMLAQLLVNAGPIVIQAFSADTGAAGAFQASSTVARVPLAIITPIQAMLVGPLVGLTLAHDRSHLRRVMVRVGLAAVAIAAAGAGIGWWIGPGVVELIFGPDRALPGVDMAILIAGVVVHVALIIFTQAIVATGAHRAALVAWAVAVAVAVAVFAAALPVAGPVAGVELGFGVGSLAGSVIALAALLRRARAAGPDRRSAH